MKITPTARRFTARDRPDGFEVIVPAPRTPLQLIIVAAMLLGGAWTLNRRIPWLIVNFQAAERFDVMWTIAWTIGCVLGLGVFLWMLAGREQIVLRPRALEIRREVFGVGWTSEYDLAAVEDLRVAPAGLGYESDEPLLMRLWGGGREGSTVTFGYGARTIRIANGVDEREATQIVHELKARHTFKES